LSVLYENNIIECKDSFVFSKDASWNLKDGDETIEIFKANETNEIANIRKAFLKQQGIKDEDIEGIGLTEFAMKADNWLSESILIINV
ncbi:hypothetical protein IKQ19_10225, partial [Candidatus Saccharibacteria bacterium]|nr:hypothetical protein [Candidatus Saccharibacteria bacterium]